MNLDVLRDLILQTLEVGFYLVRSTQVDEV